MIHPESVCERCGGANLLSWHAPSPLWNTVMRDEDGTDAFNGIVCPRCFGELAQAKGVAATFCLTTHDAQVPLPTVSPGGRIWNPERCMWEELVGHEAVIEGDGSGKALPAAKPYPRTTRLSKRWWV